MATRVERMHVSTLGIDQLQQGGCGGKNTHKAPVRAGGGQDFSSSGICSVVGRGEFSGGNKSETL